MEDLQAIQEIYLTLGIGGLSFVVLVVVLVFLLKSVLPTLNTIKDLLVTMENNQGVTDEVLRNSTRAIEELAKSNDNVANALELLKNSTETMEEKIDHISKTSERTEKDILVIKTKLHQ